MKQENIILIIIRSLPLLFITTISILLAYIINIEHKQSLQNEIKDIEERYIISNKNIIKADINTIKGYFRKNIKYNKIKI